VTDKGFISFAAEKARRKKGCWRPRKWWNRAVN